MNEPSAYVSVEKLSKQYGGRGIVNDVAFAQGAGEFISLLGPSGSGKTTVLRMIAGLVRPDGGSIQIGGQEVFSARNDVPVEMRGIGMVFQDFALWPHMTVGQNIAFGLRLRRVSSRETRSRVSEMLSLVDLVGYERRFPNQLSGGQQQRVALARALATHPKLLLLDEPLSSLDTSLRETMREELVRIIRRAEMTVINVTHDQDEAMVMSDRIILIKDGRVQQTGTPAELYWQPSTTFVAHFMGPANVMSGLVVGHSGGEVTVQRDNLTLTGSVRGQAPWMIGDEGAILFRPDDVIVNETEGDPATRLNTLEGRVSSASFSGGRWRLRIAANAGIEVLAASDRPFSPSSRVWLTIAPDRCVPVQPDLQATVDLRTSHHQNPGARAQADLMPQMGNS